MPLLYSQAKEILSKFAGKGGYCPGGNPVDSFVRSVLQYMLYEGAYGNERKFCFHAKSGCITVPFELETPLKIKIDGRVGTVWDRWFEFYSTAVLDNCIPAQDGLFEDPNEYPTVYDLPKGGARVGVTATASESPDAFIIVQGKDTSGREVVTSHNGEQLVGEKLKICWGDNRYTQVKFGTIDHIIKSPTVGYVNLYWHDPKNFLQGFLSSLSPLEEKPSLRRFRLTSLCNCKDDIAKVSIVGRIRLKEKYSDNDFIPFDNIYAMSLAGETINASYREKIDVAISKSKLLNKVLDSENAHKKINNGKPLEFYIPLSGGSIKPLY